MYAPEPCADNMRSRSLLKMKLSKIPRHTLSQMDIKYVDENSRAEGNFASGNEVLKDLSLPQVQLLGQLPVSALHSSMRSDYESEQNTRAENATEEVGLI